MPVKLDTYSRLKSLGEMPWQKVITEGLYNEALLLNKVPDFDPINGETVSETISNRKEGYVLEVILDLDFVKAKALKHICKYFNASQKEQFLKFCNEVWESHTNADIERIANELVATQGGSKEDWLKLIKAKAAK